MKWLGWTLTLLSTMAVSGGVTGGVAFHYLVGSRAALVGTEVEGHVYDPALHQAPGSWLETRRTQLLDTPLYLKTPEDMVEVSFADLGLQLDVAQTLRHLQRQRTEGSVLQRVGRALSARRGLLQLKASYSFNREQARTTLEALAPLVYRPAVNAQLDVVNHRRVESQVGRSLDVEATLNALEEARLAGTLETGMLDTRQLAIEPEVTSDMLADIDVSKVLASFDTSFRNKAGNREVNIRRAAKYLNGFILAPGATLSFNKVVGPREEDRGFTWAPVIINDEMEKGIGGGVCQVATALHAAAVYGWLDIKQRRSHSRPSGYAPLGLDATVIYGKVDLKIQNPFDTALMVHAYFPSRYVLRVELLGREPVGEVKHVYAVTEKQDFVRRVSSKSFLQPGEQKRRQRGRPGYDVVSVVSLQTPEGLQKRRYRSKYYPVPEVYWVSEGSDLSELPELPEGATHTEHGNEALQEVDEGSLVPTPLRG